MIIDVSWKKANVWYGSIGDADEITNKLCELKTSLPNDTKYALMSTLSCQDLIRWAKMHGRLEVVTAIAGGIVIGAGIEYIIKKVQKTKDNKKR